jgi:hypothetical protein
MTLNPPDPIRDAVRAKVLALAAPVIATPADHAIIGDSEPLISSGVIDSFATIALVLWIEETFLKPGQELDATQAGLDSIEAITATVKAAQPGQAKAA